MTKVYHGMFQYILFENYYSHIVNVGSLGAVIPRLPEQEQSADELFSYNSGRFLATEVAQGSLRCSFQRATSYHERSSQQRTP